MNSKRERGFVSGGLELGRLAAHALGKRADLAGRGGVGLLTLHAKQMRNTEESGWGSAGLDLTIIDRPVFDRGQIWQI